MTLAAVAPVSRPVWGPEAEWRRGLCCGGPTAWGDRDQYTSLERDRLSAWRLLSGTALVFEEQTLKAQSVQVQLGLKTDTYLRKSMKAWEEEWRDLAFTRESCS